MPRLIDADALRLMKAEECAGHTIEYAAGWKACIEWIKTLPTIDAVPVVRCKDCKFSNPWYRDKSRCFLWYEEGIDVFNDGFCSYGKRKDDVDQPD